MYAFVPFYGNISPLQIYRTYRDIDCYKYELICFPYSTAFNWDTHLFDSKASEPNISFPNIFQCLVAFGQHGKVVVY